VRLGIYDNFASIFPGSTFEDVDVAEEAKTAKISPRQRCFVCGSARMWKKSGGMSLNIACLNALMSVQDRVADVQYSMMPNA
jgi:hypothetical protein